MVSSTLPSKKYPIERNGCVVFPVKNKLRWTCNRKIKHKPRCDSFLCWWAFGNVLRLSTPRRTQVDWMDKIALNGLAGQYLNQRIDDIEITRKEVLAWQESRNNRQVNVNCQFATKDAQIKLPPLHPTLESWQDTGGYTDSWRWILI